MARRVAWLPFWTQAEGAAKRSGAASRPGNKVFALLGGTGTGQCPVAVTARLAPSRFRDVSEPLRPTSTFPSPITVSKPSITLSGPWKEPRSAAERLLALETKFLLFWVGQERDSVLSRSPPGLLLPVS